MSLLGERLRQAREARGIAPLQGEIDTRIRATVIQALEQGDFESLPPEPFLRGLIRTYSLYLGLDPEEMIALYVADFAPPPPPPPPVRAPAKKPVLVAPAPIPLAPPPSMPEEIATPPPPRVPPPPMRMFTSLPPPPPEEFAPTNAPEKSGETLSAFWLRRLRSARPPLPLPLLILLGVAIAFAFIACSAVILTQFVPTVAMMINSPRTATPTRIPATRTPTLQPGALPTGVPTFAATAPPFATVSGNPAATPTARTTPRRTIEAAPTGLNLDIDATEQVTVQIGVDGVLVFSGTMAAGSSRSWSAKDSLYMRVENAKGAAIIFNSKTQAARTFAERTTMERQWKLDAKGAAISAPPVAPPPLPNQPAPIAPTPTLTPTA